MIDIALSENARKLITTRLNILLANEYILYTKTLKYHWNVQGTHFGPLHDLFRTHYEQLFFIIDSIAERIASLGLDPLGTLNEFISHSILIEEPGENPNERGMIENLFLDHQTIIKQLREDIDLSIELNDAGTNNFLSNLIEQHEKTAWILRAHLE
jgi:starvation-inducible DNA-binding protein